MTSSTATWTREDAVPTDAPVPLTILTGFLGAGKTTLLNRILSGDHGLRVGVLVNDFGSINIDAELVVGVDGDAISLANGCVCCELRDDLVESVMALLKRPEKIEYMLLEASGVADPGGIFLTFNDPTIHDRIRLDGVTCVLDADQVFAYPEYPALMDLKLHQVGFADMVVLNKVSLAGPSQLDKVKVWLDEHFNRLRVIEADHCDVPYAVLLGVGRFDPVQSAQLAPSLDHDCADAACSDEHMHSHADLFATWSYETPEPVDTAALREVLRTLPSTIIRVKGVVFGDVAPDRRLVVQVVGRRVNVSVERPWSGAVPRTQIVAIGAAEMDRLDLNERFNACVGSNG